MLECRRGRCRGDAPCIASSQHWEGEQWIAPVNLMFTKPTKLGTQLVSWGARRYLDAREGGPKWGARFVFTLLYPRKG
jgi:hypothetical protein